MHWHATLSHPWLACSCLKRQHRCWSMHHRWYDLYRQDAIRWCLQLISYLGIALWLFGFIVEVTADNQKTEFRKNPDNRNRFITTGVWSWSQHANYFGEITLWFGLALVALPVLSGWQLATLISPVFVYFLLTKVSGIPLLDRLAKQKWGTNSDYLSYTQATSKLLLWPPKT